MTQGKKIMEQIYVVSHCLLNPAARVKGIKKPIPFETKDKKMIQLPCPETMYFGVDRRENTKDRLDFPKYRRFCQELFQPYAAMIEMFQKDGYEIIIVGVPKSPSCGVLTTCVGRKAENLGNGKKALPNHEIGCEKGVFIEEIGREKGIFIEEIVSERGVFIEEIEKELEKRRIFYEIVE
jgi:predicted secreted protein